MATLTPNYNLSKPESTDDYRDFINSYGGNMDIIDQNMGGGGGNANQNIAEEYDDTATYAVGDYVIYNGLLYKCDTAVTTSETFDPTKWTHVVVTDEMGSGGSGGGHTIYDKDGTALAQESGLQFKGAVSVSDDSVNGRTVVDVEGGGNYYLNTIYSTEEKKIGYWTDGKPLYEIVITTTYTGMNVDSVPVATIPNYNNLLIHVMHGYNNSAKNGTSFAVEMNYAHTSPTAWSNYYWVDDSTGQIKVGSGSSQTIKNPIFILQYTKTTDTPELNPQIGNVIYLPTIYSEEEREVGVWRDGKPVYQKTVAFGALPANSSKTVAHNIPNIENVVNYFGIAKNPNTTDTIQLVYVEGATDKAEIVVNQTNIIAYVSGNFSGFTYVYVTIQYTKTTDTAGSGGWTPSGARAVHYSTNEQVIGTWIDGKPLYEKVVIIPNTSVINNTFTYPHGILNIEFARITNATTFDTSGNVFDLPLINNDGTNLGARLTATDIIFRGTASLNVNNNRNLYITIQYTKTTD